MCRFPVKLLFPPLWGSDHVSELSNKEFKWVGIVFLFCFVYFVCFGCFISFFLDQNFVDMMQEI